MIDPAIVDTNVVVAGFCTATAASPTARILDGMVAGRFPFVLSDALLAEYRRVLLEPRIARRHGLGADAIDAVLRSLVAFALPCAPVGPACLGDDHLLAMLDSVPAAVLVTGDQPLRTRVSRGRRVLSPRAYVALLDSDR